jgi:hypothetical protein
MLKSASAADGADCPAPEILAAFYDRSLSRSERTRVDAHLTSCVRCQSMMASIARADDADGSPAPAQSARRFSWIPRLLAPAALVGVMVAIAISLRTREQRTPEVIALASPQALAQLKTAQRPKVPPPAVTAQSKPVPQAPSAAAAVEESPRGPRMNASSSVGRGIGVSQGAAQSAHRELAEEKPESAPTRNLRQSAASIGSAPPQNAPALGATAMSAAPGTAISSGAMTTMADAPRTNWVSSPDGSVAWQFGHSGVILRSTTSGASFMHSGVTTDLLAAAASSNDVCWMVGKSGTILRTLDSGAHWQLIKPPSRDNFTAISATDSDNAAVVAAGGQRFVTYDGGVTWSSP